MASWRAVEGWPYEVSRAGLVRHSKYKKVLRPMWCGRKRKQYATIRMCDGARGYRDAKVHILVLEAFVGPRPKGMQGLHKSDNERNNRLSNLYWGTPNQNAVDAVNNGDHLDAWAVRDIRAMRQRKVLGRIVASKYGISEQMVCDIFKRRCYDHVP